MEIPIPLKTISSNNSGVSPAPYGWYCHGCEEESKGDIRQCGKRGKSSSYHEECVGLSVEDADAFQYPDGSWAK